MNNIDIWKCKRNNIFSNSSKKLKNHTTMFQLDTPETEEIKSFLILD